MDGIHDLGGVQGFGSVSHSPTEPVFDEEWERGAMRLVMALMLTGHSNTPAFRHGIERMDPAHYLESSYYEHWMTSVSTLAVEAGLTSPAELVARAGGSFPLSNRLRAGVPEGPHDDRTEPRFAVGDRVRVRDMHSLGHTRSPRYVQGRSGVITRIDGAFPYPDVEAHGGGRVLDPAYSVRFSTRELWGEGANDDAFVHVDLCERYLEAAP